ncbi:MAG: zf-HC2 domain-containing protein [Candidatus Zixiibacteriota bacterium]
MTCSHIRALLDDLLDRELPPSIEASVKGHIQACESCRREFEELDKLRGLMFGLSVPEPPTEYWQESLELIRARTVESVRFIPQPGSSQQRTSERAQFYRALLAVAASLIVFFGSLLIGSSDSLVSRPQAVAPSSTTPTSIDLPKVTVSRTNYISADEQTLIAGSMLLVGTPGMLASSSSLAIALGSD